MKRPKIGTLYWESYKPGRERLYQLQKIVNIHGGISELSSWMTAAERRTFIEGWRKGGSRRKLPRIN